jgi:hypothetical protein
VSQSTDVHFFIKYITRSSVDATALPQGDADADRQSTAQTMTEGTTWARRLRPRNRSGTITYHNIMLVVPAVAAVAARVG